MSQIDLKTAAAQLKKGELSSLYYFFGGDVASVEKLTKLAVRAAVGENEDLALTRLAGNKLDFSELADMVQMAPMLSEYNCILINDYNCEKPREDMRGYTADDLNKKLIEVLKTVPEYTVVILNVTGFEVKVREDFKTHKRSVTDKNKKLFDFVSKNGVVCEAPAKTPEMLGKEIAARVSARGGMISIPNARLIAEMCLSDSLMIANEIDKLCARADGAEITSDMIRELVHPRSDVTSYKLAKAVAAADRKTAFEAIDELNITNDNRGLIFAAVSGTFLDLYRAVTAKVSGRSMDDVISDFSYKQQFVVKNAFRDSSRMSLSRLRKSVQILRDTAVQFNSSPGDPRVILEQAVTKMFMTKN